MASEKVLELSNDNFTESLGDDTPILVDFWASWCGPCRLVAPVLDELADELDGKVRIGKVDVDRNQELAARFNVSSIPTFILFKNGEAAGEMRGAMPKKAFEKFIAEHTA